MRIDAKVQLLKNLAYGMTTPDLNVFKLLLDDAHEENKTSRNQEAMPSPKRTLLHLTLWLLGFRPRLVVDLQEQFHGTGDDYSSKNFHAKIQSRDLLSNLDLSLPKCRPYLLRVEVSVVGDPFLYSSFVPPAFNSLTTAQGGPQKSFAGMWA